MWLQMDVKRESFKIITSLFHAAESFISAESQIYLFIKACVVRMTPIIGLVVLNNEMFKKNNKIKRKTLGTTSNERVLCNGYHIKLGSDRPKLESLLYHESLQGDLRADTQFQSNLLHRVAVIIKWRRAWHTSNLFATPIDQRIMFILHQENRGETWGRGVSV